MIRARRIDLTDYVMHMTKDDEAIGLTAQKRLKQIIRDHFIRPTFAPMPNRRSAGKTKPTIKGPYPAVCLTEQPLWALVEMENLPVLRKRYSGYGIAFHKGGLHLCGARPVIYGDEALLGRRVCRGEDNYEEGKEIYTGGLPLTHQYRWTRYLPALAQDKDYPFDFTWEREWRYQPSSTENGLEILGYPEGRLGAIIVRYDEDIASFRTLIRRVAKTHKRLSFFEHRIVSLETADTQLKVGHQEYGRLETWPWETTDE